MLFFPFLSLSSSPWEMEYYDHDFVLQSSRPTHTNGIGEIRFCQIDKLVNRTIWQAGRTQSVLSLFCYDLLSFLLSAYHQCGFNLFVNCRHCCFGPFLLVQPDSFSDQVVHGGGVFGGIHSLVCQARLLHCTRSSKVARRNHLICLHHKGGRIHHQVRLWHVSAPFPDHV